MERNDGNHEPRRLLSGGRGKTLPTPRSFTFAARYAIYPLLRVTKT
jgi:hypothetical protein